METNTTPDTNTDAADNTIQTAEITLEREQQAWKLRLKGWNQERIANHLGVDQATVSRMLKRARTRLAEEYTAEKVQMIAEQAELLLHVVHEALQAWEASKHQPEPAQPQPTPTPAQTTPSSPEIQQPLSPPESASPKIGGQGAEGGGRTLGKPTFLRIVIQALKALQPINALLGIDTAACDAFQHIPCPPKKLIGIDMERFRKGLGDPDDDPQFQPAHA